MGFRRKTQQTESKHQQSSGSSKDSSKGKQGSKSGNFVRVGTLMQTKDGSKVFLKITDPSEDKYAKFEEITVDGRKVKGVMTDTVEEVLERLVKSGAITEEQAEDRLNRTPDTILGEVTFILED